MLELEQPQQPLVVLDARGLAPFVKLSPSTISHDTSRRPQTLPPFFRIGRKALWLYDDVVRWLKIKNDEAKAAAQAQLSGAAADSSPSPRGPGGRKRIGG
jgi:hypothetical protein